MTASPRGTIGQTSATETGQVIEQIDQETGADQRLDSAVAAGAQQRIRVEPRRRHRLAAGAPGARLHSTLPGLRMPLGSSVRLSVFISS